MKALELGKLFNYKYHKQLNVPKNFRKEIKGTK